MDYQDKLLYRFTLIMNKLLDSGFVKNKTDFSDKLGVTRGNLSEILAGRTKIGTDVLLNFCKNFNVDLNYMAYGEPKSENIEGNIIREEETQYQVQKIGNSTENKGVIELPIYNIEASAGLVQLFNDFASAIPVSTLSIPNLPKSDGGIYVTGDSMYPILKSGDIVAYRVVHDIKNGIFFGETYVISIEIDNCYYTSVKYIQKSDLGDDYIKLVSQNKHHQDKDVPVSAIKALALVTACVRYFTMS